MIVSESVGVEIVFADGLFPSVFEFVSSSQKLLLLENVGVFDLIFGLRRIDVVLEIAHVIKLIVHLNSLIEQIDKLHVFAHGGYFAVVLVGIDN